MMIYLKQMWAAINIPVTHITSIYYVLNTRLKLIHREPVMEMEMCQVQILVLRTAKQVWEIWHFTFFNEKINTTLISVH